MSCAMQGYNFDQKRRRKFWRQLFVDGASDKNPILEVYRSNRDSLIWKTLDYVEHLCEYVLFLEESNMDQDFLSIEQRKAHNLRKSGMTYKQVGDSLGVNAQRARYLIQTADKLISNKNSVWNGLSKKTSNILTNSGFQNRNEVLIAIEAKDGVLLDIPNYGYRAHLEVCNWLGIEMLSEEPESIRQIKHRYITFLEYHGYEIKKVNQK